MSPRRAGPPVPPGEMRRGDTPSSSRWSDWVVETGVLFLLVFTPLAFGTVEVWSEAIAELVVLGMVVAWLLGMMLRDWELRVELPPGWLAASLFVALIFLQAAPIPMALAHVISPWTTGFYDQAQMYTGAGPSRVPLSLAAHNTWREALKIGAVAAFFLVCYNVYRTRAQVHRAIWTMIAVGATISVLGIVQRVTWNGRFYWIGPEAPHRNAFGPFVNRAHFAGLMVVVVPMALALWLASRHTPTRKQLFRTLRDRLRSWNTSDGGPTTSIPFLVLVMGGATLVSGTRGGLVALLVTLLAMIAAGMRERTGAATRIAAYGGLVVLAGLWIGSDVVQGTFGRLVEEIEQGSESSRILIWGDALALWRHAPALGTGLATFETVFPGVRTIVAPVVFTHAESDWVQILTDTGLVGLLAVLTTLAVTVVSCLRLRTHTRVDILAVGAAVATLGVAIQGVGNFSFVVMSNLLYIAVAVGVVCPYLRGRAADHA
jgi:O-antigen ligase